MKFIENDGGRTLAGFRGITRDCVPRSISIATGKPYLEVYNELKKLAGKGHSPRKGVAKKLIRSYMESLGWAWKPTMAIGSGCKVHLRESELPAGKLVVSTSRHLTAVIDGVIHDAYDPQRGGTRCVYGYYYQKEQLLPKGGN